MTAAVKDVVEVFSHARAKAILEGKTTQVIIRPQDGSFKIGVVGTGIVPSTTDSVAADAATLADAPPRPQPSGFTAQLSDRVHIELCDVNFNECKDFDDGVCAVLSQWHQ